MKDLISSHPAQPVTASTLPPEVPDHQMLRSIGQGSFGEVWLARNIMGELRAVKVVRSRIPEEGSRLYEREWDGIRRYEPVSRSHESLMPILHVGRNDDTGYFYYVMELADDANAAAAPTTGAEAPQEECAAAESLKHYEPRTLRSEIRRRGRLPVEECLAIGANLATALDRLHQSQLVHRDIKPDNIIFVHGRAKLADIGLVTQVDGTRSFGGTEGYVPPEGPGNPSADIFALGKVLYEIGTGRDRFDFPSLPALEEVEVAEKNRLLELNAVFLKACARPPAARHASAAELGKELLFLQAGESVARQRLLEARWAQAKRIGAWAGAALFVSVVAGGSWYLADRRAEARQRQELERRLLLNSSSEIRQNSSRDAGWFEVVEGKLAAAAKIRLDDEVRNEAATTLSGLDARLLYPSFTNVAGASAAFAPDGRLLVGGLANTRAQLIHTNGNREELAIVGEGPVGWTPEAVPVQLTMLNNRCLLREALTGRVRREFLRPAELAGMDANASVLAMTPDGAYVASSFTNQHEERVIVWDAAIGTTLGSVLATNTTALGLAPDGSLLAVGDGSGDVVIRAVPGLKDVARLPASLGRSVIHTMVLRLDPAVVPEEEAAPTKRWLLATGDQGGRIVIWDVAAQHIRSFGRGSTYDVFALAFHPEGTILASAGRSQVRLWDVTSGSLLLRLGGTGIGNDEARALAFSADGSRLAYGNKPGFDPSQVSVWEVEPDRGIRTLRGLSERVAKTCFSPDGRRLAAISTDWLLGVWELPSGRLLRVLALPRGFLADNSGFAFNHDGSQLAFASWHDARLYDLAEGRAIRSWKLPEGMADQVQFDRQGRMLLVRREHGLGRSSPTVWRLRVLEPSGEARILQEQSDADWISYDFAFPAGGEVFIAWTGQSTGKRRIIKAFDVGTGRQRWERETEVHPQGVGADWDAGGRWFGYYVGQKGGHQVLRLPGGEPVNLLNGAYAILSPSAERCANYGPSGECLVWHRARPSNRLALGLEWRRLSCRAWFSPDGKLYAAGTDDGSVLVADLAEVERRMARLSGPSRPAVRH